jgi:FtsH-binding integral membrane protein
MKKNPEKTITESMKVEISFPECVHIELVQSNDLRHYEIFLWLVSLSASVASGFWVSFSTNSSSNVLLAVSVAFTLFALVFGAIAYYYRSKIKDTKLKKVLLLDNFNNK